MTVNRDWQILLAQIVAEYEYEIGQSSNWLQLLGGTSESNYNNMEIGTFCPKQCFIVIILHHL